MTTSSRIPFLTLCLSAIAITVQILPNAARFLEFDRASIAQGEWWRLFSAHLTHFDLNHLGWDVGVFLILGTIGELQSRTRLAVTLGIASGAISAAIWWWLPDFAFYRGLSGLDCALFGLFTGALFRVHHPAAKTIGAMAVLAVGAKCALELLTGEAVFVPGASYSPVPLAHVVGLVAGMGVALARGPATVTSRRQATC